MYVKEIAIFKIVDEMALPVNVKKYANCYLFGGMTGGRCLFETTSSRSIHVNDCGRGRSAYLFHLPRRKLMSSTRSGRKISFWQVGYEQMKSERYFNAHSTKSKTMNMRIMDGTRSRRRQCDWQSDENLPPCDTCLTCQKSERLDEARFRHSHREYKWQ
jgi:hypothetical protein